MSPEELRMQLEANPTGTEYVAILHALLRLPSDAAFHLLFPLAATYSDISDLAACLLIEVEPRCPLTCEDALRMLADWQVSDHLVPFYLKLMFGKASLLEAVASMAAQMDRPGAQPMRTIAYWVKFPSVETIDGFMRDRAKGTRGSALGSTGRSTPP